MARAGADSVQTAWQHGVATVAREFGELPDEVRQRLAQLAVEIKLCKKSLFAISAAVESAGLCSVCRGACCSRGRYHFSVVDLLVYLATDTPLFAPDFNQDSCPFLADEACLMAPEFRPYTCITFNCDQIEELLPPLEQSRFNVQVAELRALYQEVEGVFRARLSGGLLHYAEKSLIDGRGILLVQ